MTARVHGESGASLILALVFIVVFSLIIVAIVDTASGSFLATQRLQERRTTAYVADGATHGAIQYMRSHPTCGRPFASPACPIPDFRWSDGGRTGITTMTARGSLLELDRTVDLQTSVDGITRIVARVVIRDSDAGEPRVDVERWTYQR
jgi:hypothetical protein